MQQRSVERTGAVPVAYLDLGSDGAGESQAGSDLPGEFRRTCGRQPNLLTSFEMTVHQCQRTGEHRAGQDSVAETGERFLEAGDGQAFDRAQSPSPDPVEFRLVRSETEPVLLEHRTWQRREIDEPGAAQRQSGMVERRTSDQGVVDVEDGCGHNPYRRRAERPGTPFPHRTGPWGPRTEQGTGGTIHVMTEQSHTSADGQTGPAAGSGGVDRSARLLAYLLTQEVLAGKRVYDTPYHVPDGIRPFDHLCDQIAAVCDRLDHSTVEVALLLRRDGFAGTVEDLLAASERLSR